MRTYTYSHTKCSKDFKQRWMAFEKRDVVVGAIHVQLYFRTIRDMKNLFVFILTLLTPAKNSLAQAGFELARSV